MFIYSCSSPAVDKRPYVYLTDHSKYILLSPDGIEKPLDMAQRISALYNGQSFYFSSWVMADENGIDISFLNEFGAAIADISYKNGTAGFSSAVFPKSFKPEYMIADFQLCFYEQDLVRRALKESGLVLETQDSFRRVYSGKKLIIEIEKNPDTVKLVNHLRGYSYTLEGDFL